MFLSIFFFKNPDFKESEPGKTKFCSIGVFPVVIPVHSLLTTLLWETLQMG